MHPPGVLSKDIELELVRGGGGGSVFSPPSQRVWGLKKFDCSFRSSLAFPVSFYRAENPKQLK